MKSKIFPIARSPTSSEVPVGTVMSRLARARAMLRSAWIGGTGATEMTCDEAEILLHALIDGELDAGHAREVEAHIATCPRCTAELAAIREMHQAIADTDLRYTAPVALRRRIEASLPQAQEARTPSRRAVLRGFAMGSAVSAIAATGLVAIVLRSDDEPGSPPRSSRRICARCRPDISPTCSRPTSTP